MSPNLALLSIPLYYILSVAPHTYAITIATQGDMSKLDNKNPRGSSFQEKIKKTLSAENYAKFERAESCHKNHFENMPLFIGAIFAGLLAEQVAKGTIGKALTISDNPTGLTRFVYSWMAVRVLYTIAYLTTTQQKYSHFRSMLWVIGTGLCFEQFWRAAVTLGDGKFL